MNQGKKRADIAAQDYKTTMQKIKEFEEKRKELTERNKAEKDIHIFAEIQDLSNKIERGKERLNLYAHFIVKNLYLEE